MKKIILGLLVICATNLVFGQNKKIELPSGLVIEIIKEGEGKPVKGSKVWVTYIGKLKETGKVFEDGTEEAVKFTLGAGEVIKGWDEGIAYIGKGGKAILYIPSEMGYGAKGSKDYYDEKKYVVPPHADLIFEVEVVKFK